MRISAHGVQFHITQRRAGGLHLPGDNSSSQLFRIDFVHVDADDVVRDVEYDSNIDAALCTVNRQSLEAFLCIFSLQLADPSFVPSVGLHRTEIQRQLRHQAGSQKVYEIRSAADHDQGVRLVVNIILEFVTFRQLAVLHSSK